MQSTMNILANTTEYQGYPHYAYVLPFEERYDLYREKMWMEQNWHICFYIAAAYLALIWVLKMYMKNREPMKVRNAVFLWDLSLAVFSTFGMIRTVPEILHVLTNYGMEFSVCNSNTNSVTAFWGSIFVYSKAPELLDTVFIVLKKQKLTGLHLIHHVLTMLVTWYHFVGTPALCRWVFGMNYSIHAFMYSYFAMKAAKIHIPDSISMAITTAQILQMIGGLVASVYAVYVNILGHTCTTGFGVAFTGVFTYVSFLYLFVNFFINRYKVLNKSKTLKSS